MKLINKTTLISFILGFIVSPVIIFGSMYIYDKVRVSDFDYMARISEMKEIKYPPPEIPIQSKVSFDWSVQNLDGTEINLKEVSNNQVVFLNFWATWCPPCVMEMPSIEKLYQEYKGRIAFVCISDEDIANLRYFKEKEKYSFPIYRIDGERPIEFKTRGVPTTFIISRDGNVVLKYTGGADWAHETVINFLEGLLK